MRYKKYNINLDIVTQDNSLPDLSSIHSDVLEDNEYLKKETLPDGVILYRAASPFSQLVSMYIPEYHPVFNFDLGIISCTKCYYKNAATRDIEKFGYIRELIFRHIIHSFFNSIPKKSNTQ